MRNTEQKDAKDILLQDNPKKIKKHLEEAKAGKSDPRRKKGNMSLQTNAKKIKKQLEEADRAMMELLEE
jgi:hypothetical protein